MNQTSRTMSQLLSSLVIVIALLATISLSPELGGQGGVVTARQATPAATPVAPGCGNRASGPTEIAEVFVSAATHMDLERAARCFPPDDQPERWDDVFLGAGADLGDCLGQPYTVLESKVRPRRSAIIFTFDQACVIASLDPWQRDLYGDAKTLTVTTVVVQTGYADHRWYVLDAFALVPD